MISRYAVYLGFLIIFQICLNILFLRLNTAPPSWDAANHTSIAIDIAKNLREINIVNVFKVSNYYPIFTHLCASMLILFFGPNIKLVQFTGTIFFVASIVAVYFYAREVLKDKQYSLIAALIFSFSPIVFSESRRMMLDLPLTGLFWLSLLFLEKSFNFTKFKYTLLFCITFSFMLLTKWTGIFFIVIPLLSTFFTILREKRKLKVFSKLMMLSPLILIILAPWYVVNLASVERLSLINTVGESTDPISVWSIQNLSYYLLMIINYLVTFPVFVLFVFSILFHKVKFKNKNSLTITFLFSYLVFTFIKNKDPRYIMPIIPLISIFSAAGLFYLHLNYKRVSVVLNYFIVLFSLVYVFLLTARPVLLEGLRLSFNIPSVGWVNLLNINDDLSKKYKSDIFPTEKIISDIPNNISEIVSVYESEELNPSNLSMYLKRNQYLGLQNRSFIKTPDIAYLLTTYGKPSFPSDAFVADYLKYSDYLVVGSSKIGYLRNKEALDQIVNFVNENSGCAGYETILVDVGGSCRVLEGDTLTTNSDLLVNGTKFDNSNFLPDNSIVSCPWGCSFKLVRTKRQFHFVLVNKYLLPSGDQIETYLKRPDL